VIHGYLGHNIAAIQKLMGISSLVTEMSGKSTSVLDYTHCINKENVCSGSNINHNGKEVFQISAGPILYRPSAKIHFSMKFHVISNIFFFIS
jgi:hypothetical protein